MAKRRTKNIDTMIETLEARLFRTVNALYRYKLAKRRIAARLQKEKEALRKPKAVALKLPKPPKPVDLTKPKKMPKALRPQGTSVEVWEPEAPVPPIA